MSERARFVFEWESEWERAEGRVNMAALCRAFGVSRQTGYKWLRRYIRSGRKLSALDDRSRRPKASPAKTSKRIERAILRLRRSHRWGARKLQAVLRRKAKGMTFGIRPSEVPSASTIGRVLNRHQMTKPRSVRHRSPPFGQPFRTCSGPNAVWCVDFKGHFRTKDGTQCYPLTMMDAFSRKLLECHILRNPDGKHVRPIFERAFRAYGLPAAIRSDNGPPFASVGPGGLTELSVWWTTLRIRHERITPGKPQENGRHERMHLTLKQSAITPPAATAAAQQLAFDRFMRVYNAERPHEALGGRTPNELYAKSPVRFPLTTEPLQYPLECEERRVWSDGKVRLSKRKIHVGKALIGKRVGLRWIRDQRWEVLFGPVTVGIFDLHRNKMITAAPRRGGRVSKQQDIWTLAIRG